MVARSVRALEAEDRRGLGRGIRHADQRAPERLELGPRARRDPLAATDEDLHRPGSAPLSCDLGQPRQPERIADDHVEAILGEPRVGLERVHAPDDHREHRCVAHQALDEQGAEAPVETKRGDYLL